MAREDLINETKTCLGCEEDKSIEHFWIGHKSEVTGEPLRRNYCIDCCMDKQREKKGVKKRTRKNGEVLSLISGKHPEPGEVSIYVLYNEINREPFYVGSTVQPRERHHSHLATFGADTVMGIVKNVPEEESTYWESKIFVEYHEAGYRLLNKETIRRRKK